jgi:hypothetical protein
VKRFVYTTITVLTFGAGQAMAACSPPLMTASQIQTLLAGNTACVGHTPSAEWSEWHNGGMTGSVVDWKKGLTDPIDPTTNVGTYTIASSITAGEVTYTYGSGGPSYSYYVQQGSTNPYIFCGVSGSPILSVTVNPGQGPC